MNKLLSDNGNLDKLDFSHLKNNKCLTDPNVRKSIAVNNAKGSSFLEGINLPENFFLVSYELPDNKRV